MWKWKGFSDKSIKPPVASNQNPAPGSNYINTKSKIKFYRTCLKQDKVTFTHQQLADTYTVYVIDLRPFIAGKDFWLGNFLFGTVKLTKNPDPDKYNYSAYGIKFDERETFSLSDCGSFGKNVIIFGTDMSSLAHIDNRKKDILVLGNGPTDGLDDSTLTTEKEYSINFTKQQNTFRLRLHYNGIISYWCWNL